MDNIFENTQGNISLELADFYNKSFMVNGDPNLSSFMPSANPSVPDNKDEFSNLANQLNTNSKIITDKFSNPQGNFNDPFAQAKIYGFNPSFKGLNMDRYDDKELGFDPFRDNEKFYNDNTSMFYDFGRAFGGMGRLAAGAFVDSATSLGRMVQGDFDISKDFAMDSERIMAETMSTKSGFLPGVANFLVNTGFTVGMMAEMVAEEALILGASLLLAPESGGTSLGAGGYLAALRAQMAFTKVGAAWKGMGNLKKALTSLDNVNDARKYFTQFGKNTIDFLNPVRNTTDLFVGGNKLAGLGQMAQLSKGFGAFFRDVRDMNRSLSEARLEGGFVYNKMFDDLVNEHIERTGKEPTPQEIEGIKNIAHTAGISTELINLPVIHYTNNIVFGNLSRPLTKFLKGTDDTLKILGSRFDLVDNVWQEVGKGFGQSLRRGLNPRNIAKNSLNYFSANLAEGLQESFQEATAIATEDYYKNLYFNENSLGKKLYELSWLDSYGKGIGAQFSTQGFEVFASGFLMGGVINNVSKALTKSINYVHETVSDKRAQARAAKDPEFKIEYEKQKAEKEIKIAEAKKAIVEGLNTLYSDPNKMFAPDLENMTAQEILDQKIRAAGANNDRKFLIDFTDESFFKHVSIANQVGKFDSLIERIQGRLELNDDELAQAMGVKDGAAARARLEVSIDRAKEIKRRYDLAPKNPIDLSRLKPNTQEYYEASLLKKSFDDSVTDMIFSQVSFDRKLERMENITRDFANVNVISNAPAAPLMHLFGRSNMMREIDLSYSEIQSLDPKDPKSIKIIDEKVALLSKLNTLLTKIDEFTKYDKETRASEEMAGEDIQNPKYAEAIREAFASYLEEYAKINKGYVKADNLDNAFELLYDYYRLGNDTDRLSRSVAVVSNPNFITEEASRKFNALKKIHENRKEYIQKSVDKFFELIGLNDVFSKFKDLGVAVDPEEALEFNKQNGNYKFKKFRNAKTLEIIKPSDPLMEKINKIISDYEKEIGITAKEEAKAKAEEEAKKEEEIKKEAEEAKKAETKPVDDILAGLDSKTIKELKDAYNDIERDDKESFEEFLDSPQAKRIIAKATRGKEPEEKEKVPTTKVPLNGIEGVNFGIDGVTLDGFTIDGNYYNVLSHYGRAKTLVNINGVIVPFYLTSGSGGKGLIPGWYPFAGIGQDGWLNKTGKSDMESYYSRLIGQENADLLKSIAAKLNKQYGTDPEVFKNPDADPTTTDKPISSLANKTEDYINSKLPFTPASNNTSETLIKFESNMTQLGEALTNAKITPKTETEIQPKEAPTGAQTQKADIEGQVGTSNYSVDSGLIFYNNPDGTVTPVANPKGKPVMDIITADIERRRQEDIDKLFEKTQASVDKKLNTPVEKISKEEAKEKNKDLIAELENPDFLNSKEREEEWDKKADDLSDKLPKGISWRVTNGKIEFFDNQDYREKGFGTRNIVPVNVFSIHNKSEKFEVGDSIQVDDGIRALPAIVTKVNENGKILEARQDDGRLIISKGNIITTAPIDERIKIDAKYDAELDALEGTKPAETKTESELPGNIKPVKPKVEAELTDEEVNIIAPRDLKSPFSELDPLYNGDQFILTEDGKFYFNQSKPKEKAKRVSDLKPKSEIDKLIADIAAERGNVIDFLLRRFFEDRITADNINMAANAFIKDSVKKKIIFEAGFFDELFKKFELIKEEFDQKEWTIISDLPTLFGTLGIKLYAGTTDLLARDKDGNYFIIDLKTSGKSRRADYEKQLLGESNYGYSTADRIQQNAYRELLKQRTGIEVKGLFILPLIVEGNIGIISGKANSVELDTPVDGSYLLPVDMSKNIYEILPDQFIFEQVPQVEQEFPVSPQVAGKIVYASPGIGKSRLVSEYPNQFVDMDQLLAEEFTALGYKDFTADNVGSKVYDLFRTADYDEVKSIVDETYRKAFDRAREMTKTGVTVLTGSPRFLVGKGSMRYVDLAVIASDENIIRKQLEKKNPTATKEEIDSLVSRIRADEKNANVLIEVNSEEFINFIQGTLPISSYIINANTNAQILNIEKLIPISVSEEDLATFMAKKQLMLDRKQMFEQVEAGDIVELSINDGKDTIALVVDRVIPYYKNQTKIIFKPNSNKIKDLIPAKSFSIVSVSKANVMPSKPDVSAEAENNAKDNVTKMDDFTSETDRLKKLLEEDFNEDDLFSGAEDPDNCNI